MERVPSPRFGLRFDRGRAQLVLGEPLDAGPLRLESLVCELAVAKGRVSLTEGWRAFRHRRTTLNEARVSIALADLAHTIGEAIGAEVSLIGARTSLSLAARTGAQAIATDVTWGWDGADVLLVLSNARALPRGPRGPIAAAHDLFASLSLELDPPRGAVRVTDPLRRSLLEALLPVGVRVPDARGLARTAYVEAGRLVLIARSDVESAEPARESLEAARTLAGATTALVDGELSRARRFAAEHLGSSAPLVRARAIAHAVETGDAPTSSDATALGLAAQLTQALEDRPLQPAALVEAALAYARAEPHGGVAAEALVLAAAALASHGSRGPASALAAAALGRLPIERTAGTPDVSLLTRAITLASSDAAARDATAWEPIVRVLGERAASERGDVTIARAHALALESAGRATEALAAFRAVLRRDDDEPSATGLARVLEQIGRWDEALSAWDRVASLRASMGHNVEARRARLRAAEAAEREGLAEAAIARLTEAIEDAPPDVAALEATSSLASKLASVGRGQEAAALDRRLPGMVDVLGPSFAIEGQAVLTSAAERALARRDEPAARGAIDALARLVPESAVLPALTRALDEVGAARRVEGDPAALRKRAEALRTEGKSAEAARVLIELFARTSDAAVLRAAIELADRADDREARDAVFDRALALLPPGAARDAIVRRRG